MIFSTAVLAVIAFAAFTNAQQFSASDIKIDPASVNITTRQNWCYTQTQSCPLLCDNGEASPNTCVAETLAWNCTCTTGNAPNFTDYSGTIPSYICETWQSDCVQGNLQNASAQQSICLSVTCGAKAPGAADVSSSSTSVPASSSTSSTTATSASSPSKTSATATQHSTGAATTLNIAREYGTGILAAALFGLFGLVL